MSEIKDDPLLLLPDIEDVRGAIASNAREAWKVTPGMFQFRVRSEWIIGLIAEITEAGKTPYNADVKKLALERLGFEPLARDADYSREGDTLSILIYNAQCYRRSDAAKAQDIAETAAGWLHPSQEWLRERVGQRVEVLHVEGLARVDRHPKTGEYIIRPPRSRNKQYGRLDKIKVRDAGDAERGVGCAT